MSKDGERRIDLQSELGMTRRDLLRRGAIVGGTLLWVAPAIQSLPGVANAQTQRESPITCGCCACSEPIIGNLPCATDHASFAECEAICASVGATVVDHCTSSDPSGVCSCIGGTTCQCTPV